MSSPTLVTAVVSFNCLLALLCLGLAWRLWRLGQTLRQLRWMLGDLTQQTAAALGGTRDALVAGQQGAMRLHWRYRRVNQQLQQLRQVLLLVSWVQGWVWRSGKGDRQTQGSNSRTGVARTHRP